MVVSGIPGPLGDICSPCPRLHLLTLLLCRPLSPRSIHPLKSQLNKARGRCRARLLLASPPVTPVASTLWMLLALHHSLRSASESCGGGGRRRTRRGTLFWLLHLFRLRMCPRKSMRAHKSLKSLWIRLSRCLHRRRSRPSGSQVTLLLSRRSLKAKRQREPS